MSYCSRLLIWSRSRRCTHTYMQNYALKHTLSMINQILACTYCYSRTSFWFIILLSFLLTYKEEDENDEEGPEGPWDDGGCGVRGAPGPIEDPGPRRGPSRDQPASGVGGLVALHGPTRGPNPRGRVGGRAEASRPGQPVAKVVTQVGTNMAIHCKNGVFFIYLLALGKTKYGYFLDWIWLE